MDLALTLQNQDSGVSIETFHTLLHVLQPLHAWFDWLNFISMYNASGSSEATQTKTDWQMMCHVDSVFNMSQPYIVYTQRGDDRQKTTSSWHD